jgi:heterodisulfide reductase subunit D
MQKIENCYQCGLCSGICPKRKVSKYSPRVRINEYLMDGQKDASWECLTCGLCSQYCPQTVDYLNFVKNLRSTNVNQDLVAHKSVFSLLVEFMNNYPASKGVPVDFKKGDTDPNSPIAYFPGCLEFFDCFLDVGVNFHEIGESSIKLLNKIGIKPKLLSLKCCGHDALWQGNTSAFETLKRFNREVIAKSGIKTLVTSCAECFRTFVKDYDLNIEVLHISQILNKNVGKLNLKSRACSITYHDPCRLGRHMGVYDAPRNVLQSVKGVTLQELDDNRENAQCCGVSAWISCDVQNKVLITEKLDSAIMTRAETLITACPKCYAHLNCLKHEKPPMKNFKIDVVDLAVFLSRLDDNVEKVK